MDALTSSSQAPTSRYFALAALVCSLLTAGLYWQTFGHDFVYFDDDGYVLNNTMVRAGLSLESVAWAFQTLYMANWHPLTWLSYMFDASLFGVEPGWYLLHNAVLHAVNGVLVFAILWRLAQHFPAALLGAVVFIAHPLHVESVAWIAERKDVLSGLFYLWGLLAYLQWMDTRSWPKYVLVIVLCALALMAKPMAVTLPLVLILFDLFLGQRNLLRATLEKAPLLLMCLGAGLATLLAQGDGGAVSGLDVHALELRAANTLIGYTTYLRQFMLPTGLAAFYPLDDSPNVAQVALAAAVVCLMLVVIFLARKRFSLLALGTAFFFVSLLPVIGLMQVGMQAHADRYMYIPSLGLLIALMDVPRMLDRERVRLVAVFFVAWCCLLTLLCYWQIAYWENRGLLFNRVLAVNGPVYLAHLQLAEHHIEAGAYGQATSHALKALELEPERTGAQIVMGDIALRRGDLGSAEKWYLKAVSMSRENPYLLNKVGVLWAMQGRIPEALGLFERALEIFPHDYRSRQNLDRYGGRGPK